MCVVYGVASVYLARIPFEYYFHFERVAFLRFFYPLSLVFSNHFCCIRAPKLSSHTLCKCGKTKSNNKFYVESEEESETMCFQFNVFSGFGFRIRDECAHAIVAAVAARSKIEFPNKQKQCQKPEWNIEWCECETACTLFLNKNTDTERERKKRSLFGYYSGIALRPTAWSKLLALGGFYVCTIFIVRLYSTFATTLPLISLALVAHYALSSHRLARALPTHQMQSVKIYNLWLCVWFVVYLMFFYFSILFTRRPGREWSEKKVPNFFVLIFFSLSFCVNENVKNL